MNGRLTLMGIAAACTCWLCPAGCAAPPKAVETGRHVLVIQGFEGADVLEDKPNISYLSGVPEAAEVEVWDTPLYNRRRIPTADSGIACRVTAGHKTQGRRSLEAKFTRDDRVLRVSLRNNISQPSRPDRPACNSLGCFDYLRGDVFNPAADTVRCEMTMLGGFAVTDKAGTFALVKDLALKPGWNEFAVTSQEASAVFVDTHDATCVEFRTPGQAGTVLHFDNFRMERQTIGRNMARHAKCFDFGVRYFNWPGFTYGSEKWDEKRGFGFTKYKSITHGGDLHVINDQLTRDGFYAPASFRVALPAGRYKVVTRTGNYWGRRDGGLNVEIRAEGKRVYHRPRMTAEQFGRFKFAHERTDHSKPDMDLWGMYEDGTYFREVRFDTEVSDGALDLDFLLPPLPAGVRPHGASVWNYLIVYPADKEDLIAPELDWLNEKIRTIYNRVSHAEIGRAFALYNREEVICPEEFLWPDLAAARRAALKPAPAETKRGYLHFLRHRHDLITPHSVPLPNEVGDRLAVFAAPGETAAWAVGIYPLTNLKAVTVEAGDLRPDAAGKPPIPASRVEVRLASYRPMTPVTSNHAECFHYIGPGVLIPPQPTDVPKGYPRRWWFSLAVPADAAPGVYRGEVRVRAGGRQASTVQVALRVLPFRLDKPKGVTFAAAHNSTWSFWPEAKHNYELKLFGDLGLTTIWYQGQAEKLADMKKQAGRYGLSVEQGSPDKYWNARWPEDYRHVLVRRHLASGRGVSFTPRHTGHREGRKIRFTHGFWLWRSGIRHRVIQTQPNACERVYYAHAGHAKFGPCSYRFCSVLQTGLILPAPTLYEVRDGIIDWRYVQTLEGLLASASKAAPAAAPARAYVKRLAADIDPSLDRYYFRRKRTFNHVGRYGLHDTVWTGRRYQMERWEIARHVAALSGAPIRTDARPVDAAAAKGCILHAEHFGPFWVDPRQFMDYASDRHGTPRIQVETPRTCVGTNGISVLVKLDHPCKDRWSAVLTDAAGKRLARQDVGVLKRWKTRWVLRTDHLPVGEYRLGIVPAAPPAAAEQLIIRIKFFVVPGF